MYFSRLATLAASVSTATAAIKGFNYGSTNPNGAAKVQADFQNEFTTAQGLTSGPGFTSARLYTMIQAGTQNSPISAIPAAIATKTSLLLGLWASAGQDAFNNELAALAAAIEQYPALAGLVQGISCGSEDLYRITPTGIANDAGIGAGPDTLVSYISQVRSTIAGTILADIPVGHVDTWTAYVNGSNSAVISAVDFIGMDQYGYFESASANSIENGKSLFYSAYDQTVAVAQGKPVWITETGWPVSGPQFGDAVASIANSKTYYDSVGCDLFSSGVNTWWYTLYDGTPSPSFGIVGSTLSTTPLFDLTCPVGSAFTTSYGNFATATEQQNGLTLTPTTGIIVVSTIVDSPNQVSTTVATGASATATLVLVSSQLAGTTLLTMAKPTATAVAGGAPVSQISDGQVQAATTTIGAPVSQISDGQVQAATSVVGVPVSQISDGQVQAGTTTVGAPVSQISDGQVQAGTTKVVATAGAPVSQISDGQVQAATTTVAVSQISDGQVQAGTTKVIATPVGTGISSPATPSAKSCPAALSGTWEFPHLIVPVDKNQPSVAAGTSFFGTFDDHVSTTFNFDLPASYAGKTCSLVFLFPEKEDLETSDFTFSGHGGLDVYELSGPVTQGTSYSNVPSGVKIANVPDVKPGNSYVVTSHECAAGQTVSFEFEATGSLALNYFQDYNPSPLGAYITVC